MYCKLWEPRVQLWLDNELPEEEAARVARHLKQCDKCSTEVAKQQEVSDRLKAHWEQTEASPSFRERTQARLLTAFEEHLSPAPNSEWQWSLPLLKEEEA